jgi:hypothetical protein
LIGAGATTAGATSLWVQAPSNRARRSGLEFAIVERLLRDVVTFGAGRCFLDAIGGGNRRLRIVGALRAFWPVPSPLSPAAV